MRRLVVFLFLFGAGNLFAESSCKISPTSVVRGQQLSLTFAEITGPATVNFQPVNSQKPTFADPALLTLDRTPKTYAVPIAPGLTLGNYLLSLTAADGKKHECGTLKIGLPQDWQPKLFQFNPGGTYKTAAIFVGEGTTETPTDTVSVSLRGSGFLIDMPEENRILLDGQVLPVKWDGCTQSWSEGSKESPVRRESVVHGQVISAERIDLCRIPAPKPAWFSAGVMTFAVAQGDLPPTQPWTFRVYNWSTSDVAVASVLIALTLSAFVLGLVNSLERNSAIPSKYNFMKVLFLDQETNTYSLSKFQFYLWTVAALFGYSYLAISRMIVQGLSWPDIPSGLPAIVGIGVGTALGSVAISTLRGPKGGGQEEPNLGDLVTTGGATAPDRVQMFVWTILGVGIFIVAVLGHDPGSIKELDPVPTGLLAMMGLSTAGYLGAKLVRKGGPVVNSISVTPPQSDDTLSKQGAAPPAAVPSFAAPLEAANNVMKSLTPQPPAGSALNAINTLGGAIRNLSSVKTVSDAQSVLPKLNEAAAEAERQAKAAVDAMLKDDSAMATAAEAAQKAAAAAQDLAASASSIVAAVATPSAAARPNFTRVIELRGRNLSNQATIEIERASLTSTMQLPNPDPKLERLPVVAIREPEDPNLAMMLKISIDPNQLTDSDLQLYKQWFGQPTSDAKKRTLVLTNPDGQKSEISFEVK
jgi:hypothetical protein